jgi:hypothetical protein
LQRFYKAKSAGFRKASPLDDFGKVQNLPFGPECFQNIAGAEHGVDCIAIR